MSRQEHVHCARPSFAATEAVQTDSGYTYKIDMNKSVRRRLGLGLLIDWVMLTPKTRNKNFDSNSFLFEYLCLWLNVKC